MRLPRLVGQGRALEIIMTGRKIEAQECVRADRRSVYLQYGFPSSPLWSANGPIAKASSMRKAPPAPRDLLRVRAGMENLAIWSDRTTDRPTSPCHRHRTEGGDDLRWMDQPDLKKARTVASFTMKFTARSVSGLRGRRPD